uniref:Uncharacterized protein n=1 Tax=Rhipicephalus zambeziensis TaxID=60191 RepID=A0A224YIT6_9ACAR
MQPSTAQSMQTIPAHSSSFSACFACRFVILLFLPRSSYSGHCATRKRTLVCLTLAISNYPRMPNASTVAKWPLRHNSSFVNWQSTHYASVRGHTHLHTL